jgi:hypothetical protein
MNLDEITATLKAALPKETSNTLLDEIKSQNFDVSLITPLPYEMLIAKYIEKPYLLYMDHLADPFTEGLLSTPSQIAYAPPLVSQSDPDNAFSQDMHH